MLFLLKGRWQVRNRLRVSTTHRCCASIYDGVLRTDSCLTGKDVFNIKQEYLLLCSETGTVELYKHANIERHITKRCGPPVWQTYFNWWKETHVKVSMANIGAVSPFKEPYWMYTAWLLVKNALNEIRRPFLILSS